MPLKVLRPLRHLVAVTAVVGAGLAATTVAAAAPMAAASAGSVPADASQVLYVADPTTNTVYQYPAGRSSSAPVAALAGPDTGLSAPTGLAVDSSGNLWVRNSASVTEYPAGASGDTAPINTISGPGTLLGTAGLAVAVDPSGRVYTSYSGNIAEFAPGATGDAVPVHTMWYGATLSALQTDASGDIYATGNQYGVVDEYSEDFQSIGELHYDIGYLSDCNYGLYYHVPQQPSGLAVDGSGDIFESEPALPPPGVPPATPSSAWPPPREGPGCPAAGDPAATAGPAGT